MATIQTSRNHQPKHGLYRNLTQKSNEHVITSQQLGFQSFDMNQPLDAYVNDDDHFDSHQVSDSIVNFESATVEKDDQKEKGKSFIDLKQKSNSRNMINKNFDRSGNKTFKSRSPVNYKIGQNIARGVRQNENIELHNHKRVSSLIKSKVNQESSVRQPNQLDVSIFKEINYTQNGSYTPLSTVMITNPTNNGLGILDDRESYLNNNDFVTENMTNFSGLNLAFNQLDRESILGSRNQNQITQQNQQSMETNMTKKQTQQQQRAVVNMHETRVQQKLGEIDDDLGPIIDNDDGSQSYNNAGGVLREKSSFEVQYQKMTKDFITNLQNGQGGNIQMLLLSDKDLKKYKEKEHTSQNRSSGSKINLHNTLYQESNYLKEKQEKLLLVKTMKEEDEFSKNCTFQPNLISLKRKGSQNSSNSRNRSPDQFYSQMLNFKLAKEKKVEELRKQKEDQESSLSKNRNSFFNNSQGKGHLFFSPGENKHDSSFEVFERLYTLGQKKQLNRSQSNLVNVSVIQNDQSSILKRRKLDIEKIDKLYRDGSNKSLKLNALNEQKDREIHDLSLNSRISFSPKRYQHNQALLRQKISKELSKIYQILCLKDSDVLNYHQLTLLLQKLNYSKKLLVELTETDEEKQMVLDIWNALKAKYQMPQEQQKEGVSMINLYSFLCILHYAYVQDPQFKEDTQSIDHADRINSFGYISKDNQFFILNNKQGDQIRNIFKRLLTNHQAKVNEDRNLITKEKLKQQLKDFFNPSLSQKSLKMAAIQIKKIHEELEKGDKRLSGHADLLLSKGQIYKQKVDKQRESFKQIETLGCTFKPQTKEWKGAAKAQNKTTNLHLLERRKSPDQKELSGVHESLYKIMKQRKEDKKTMEIEFEKSRNQCTFKPNLSLTKTSFNNKSSENLGKGLRTRNINNLKQRENLTSNNNNMKPNQ
ncbi:UNKNOWN [Stylonychia lemnae]|uniref:Uncharacterized protein n=1 Tax=Stylonychia lemnae TaxID=5949 RepID=A0A078A554_STYLE|nr:UNKNOWN [Stylonychia lemnae]|eukprot:CDW77334.1 UNKNOWN [Stylonychia lemnae]